MSGPAPVFAIVNRKSEVCTCPKRDCPRQAIANRAGTIT